MIDATKFPKTAAMQRLREQKYEAEQARQKLEREQARKAKAIAEQQPKEQKNG